MLPRLLNSQLSKGEFALEWNCIGELLSFQAEKRGEALAVLGLDGHALSYEHLYEQVAQTVSWLNRLGLGRGDRVAVVLPNGPELAVAFLGIASGCTCAPLNPAYKEKEFEFYLSDLSAKALIVREGDVSAATVVAQKMGIPVLSLVPTAHGEVGTFELRGTTDLSPINSGFAPAADTALVLHTSGTTSRPKLVVLEHRNLCASARHVQEALGLRMDDRCLNMMPLFHIHGLMAPLLGSIASGGCVACSPGFEAPRFFEWVELFDPTWYTAVPTMHQAILERAGDYPEIMKRSRIRIVRSASSALAPTTMSQLEQVFGAPVIEAYGMTEGAHQIASNPMPGGGAPEGMERRPGSVGIAAGPKIAIMNEAGDLQGPDVIGEIVISGPNVTPAYENNPEANAASFIGEWFRTGDEGYLDSEGYLYIKGRIKEIINRGGEKISPREIDEVLLVHPAIKQAVAFAVPDERLGEEVAAAVVLRDGVAATSLELRQFASERLADFKVPRQIVIVDEIPKGPTGKLQRIGLADKLGVVSEQVSRESGEHVEARSDTEVLLAGIWAEVLKRDSVGVHDEFLSLGGDSMLATMVVSRVRDALGLEIPMVYFFETPTIAGLAEMIDEFLNEEEA